MSTAEGPYEQQKEKLQAIVRSHEKRKRARDAYGFQPREEKRSINLPPLPAEAEHRIPEAQEVAEWASPKGSEAREPEPDGVPVETDEGVVFVASPETQPDLYIQVRRPELEEYRSSGTVFEVQTGRWICSWRKRKPEDGDAPYVTEPARPLRVREPEYVRLGNWGDGSHVTWRSTDPPPSAPDRSYWAEHGRFEVGRRNRGVNPASGR